MAEETIERPFGVWVLTAYAGVIEGLVTLGAISLLWFGNRPEDFELVPTSIILGEVALVLGTMILAYLTWKGNNRGRILFVILVTFSYVLVAYINFPDLLTADLPDTIRNPAIASLIRGGLYPALNIWYFTRADTLKFYIKKEDAE